MALTGIWELSPVFFPTYLPAYPSSLTARYSLLRVITAMLSLSIAIDIAACVLYET